MMKEDCAIIFETAPGEPGGSTSINITLKDDEKELIFPNGWLNYRIIDAA